MQQAIEKVLKIKKRIFDDLDQQNWLEICDIIISELQALPDGWIPVTERLPHDDEEYIICTSDWLVTSVAWSTDENNWIVWITNWRTDIFWNITHWMPLPLSPK